ncbi:MAG: hypothetical protein ABR509_03635 [Candidatus Limnocylindria bacterium]
MGWTYMVVAFVLLIVRRPSMLILWRTARQCAAEYQAQGGGRPA